jgi:hypothetical protein
MVSVFTFRFYDNWRNTIGIQKIIMVMGHGMTYTF